MQLCVGFRLEAINIVITCNYNATSRQQSRGLEQHSQKWQQKLSESMGLSPTLFYYPKQIRLTNHAASRSVACRNLSTSTILGKSLNFTPQSSVSIDHVATKRRSGGATLRLQRSLDLFAKMGHWNGTVSHVRTFSCLVPTSFQHIPTS